MNLAWANITASSLTTNHVADLRFFLRALQPAQLWKPETPLQRRQHPQQRHPPFLSTQRRRRAPL